MNEKLKCCYIYIIILAITLMISYVFNEILITRYVFYNTFQDQLNFSRIDEIFDSQLKYSWIVYVFIPVWLLIKNFIVSICLQTGLLIKGIKLSFFTTLKIALIAEIVFLLPQLLKLCWFLFIKTEFTLTDIQQFYPLSALNLFRFENLSSMLIYPFQTFNIFEILYWLLLAGGIKQALDVDINKGITIVFTGYIPALVLWIVCVMFITVSLSPTI